MASIIEGYLGKRVDGTKSRMPARIDVWQGATGLFLGLFMWAHMLFVSTILISEDFMYKVTKMFEGSFIFGYENSKPILVSIAVFIVFVIFIIHAGIALRRFPNTYRQYRIITTHIASLKHGDTKLWFVQIITGFAMMFLGSVHLYVIMTNADKIGPYASSDRMVSGWMWPLYILLLIAVELHGSIGLYRLVLKWGWFNGKDAKATRKRLKKIKWAITVFFLLLGFATFAAYVKIGLQHRDHAGERYHPTVLLVPHPASAEMLS